MANVRWLRGLKANLPNPGVDGSYYFATDTKELFVSDGVALSQIGSGLSLSGGILTGTLTMKAPTTNADMFVLSLTTNAAKKARMWWGPDGHLHFETIAGSGADIFFHPDGGTVHLNTSLNITGGNALIKNTGRIESSYDPITVEPSLWLGADPTTPTSADFVHIRPASAAVFDNFLRLIKTDGTDALKIDKDGLVTFASGQTFPANPTNPLLVTTVPGAPYWMYEPYGLPPVNPRNNYSGALGFQFTVLQNVTVNKLGRMFLPGNSQNHVVNLWSAAGGGTLLATGTVLVASASDSNGFKWVAVAPVTLVPGVTYTIAVDETNGGDTWVDGVSNPVLNGLFGDRVVSCYTNVGGQSTYPPNTNGTGSYDAPGIQFVVGPSYKVGLSADADGRVLVGNGTDQDYSGKIVANGGFSFLAPTGTTAGGTGPNQAEIVYRQMPGQTAGQIIGDFGNGGARATPVLVLSSSRTGLTAPSLTLEGTNDAGVFPNRGGVFFHRKDAQSTALIDYEAGDLQFYTTPTVGVGVILRFSIKSNGHTNIVGVPVYANNAAAVAGGLVAGDLYRTGADPDPVCIVH